MSCVLIRVDESQAAVLCFAEGLNCCYSELPVLYVC